MNNTRSIASSAAAASSSSLGTAPVLSDADRKVLDLYTRLKEFWEGVLGAGVEEVTRNFSDTDPLAFFTVTVNRKFSTEHMQSCIKIFEAYLNKHPEICPTILAGTVQLCFEMRYDVVRGARRTALAADISPAEAKRVRGAVSFATRTEDDDL